MAAAAAPGRDPEEQALRLCHPRERGVTILCLGSAKVMAASGSWPGTPQLGRPPITTCLVWPWIKLQPRGSPGQWPILGCFLQPPPLCPLALDSALLLPSWGAWHNSAGPDDRHVGGQAGPALLSSPFPVTPWPLATGAVASLGPRLPSLSDSMGGRQSPGTPSENLGRETPI